MSTSNGGTRTSSLWHYRALVAGLVVRNIKVKYQRSALGFVWTLLNPVVMALVLITVFSYIIRVQIEHFWAFLISGFFAWNYLSTSVVAAAYTLAEHSHITRSIAFPSELLIVSAALSRLVEFGIELLLVIGILGLWLHGTIPASYALVPLLLLLLFVLTVGLQLPIATLAVFYKDVEHALPVVLTTLFYLSPVFYPVSLIPEALLPYYMASPIAKVITLFHVVLYEGRFPDAGLLWSACAWVTVVFVAGYWVFNRNKKLFAEIL
jgi:ABC-type polysaccharide/polyol phosphate export permease